MLDCDCAGHVTSQVKALSKHVSLLYFYFIYIHTTAVLYLDLPAAYRSLIEVFTGDSQPFIKRSGNLNLFAQTWRSKWTHTLENFLIRNQKKLQRFVTHYENIAFKKAISFQNKDYKNFQK